MFARHFQVTLMFSVAVEDDLQRLFPARENAVSPGDVIQNNQAREARLVMGALLSDPAALELLLKNYVVSELCFLEPADVCPLVGVAERDEAEIVGPLLSQLPVEDQAFLTWGEEPLDAAEHLDVISESVDVQLVAATLVEV
jgi:hypothetical protein